MSPAPGPDSSDIPSSIPWATSSLDGPTGVQVVEGPKALSHLKEVEGKQEFPNMWPFFREWDDTPSHPDIYETSLTIDPAAADGDWSTAPAGVGMTASDGPTYFRLTKEGGLTAIGLEDRSAPRVLSRMRVPGESIGMTMLGGIAYVIARADYSYALDDSILSWEPARGPSQYRIGSFLLVIDLSDPSSPKLLRTIGFEGFVAEACTIGETLILFSSCYAFYRQSSNGVLTDTTKVSAVDLTDRTHPDVLGAVSIDGAFRIVHVAGGKFFVAHNPSTVTIVDPANRTGVPDVLGSHLLTETIDDADSLFLYRDVLTVLCVDSDSGHGYAYKSCDAWTLDVSEPDDIFELGHLHLDGIGSNPSVLHAGFMAYIFSSDVNGQEGQGGVTTVDLSYPFTPYASQNLTLSANINKAHLVGQRILVSATNYGDGFEHIYEFYAFLLRIEANGTLSIKDSVLLGADKNWWLDSEYLPDEALLLCSVPVTTVDASKSYETVVYKSLPLTLEDATDSLVVGTGATYTPVLSWRQRIWDSVGGDLLVGSDDTWVRFIDATDRDALVLLASNIVEFPDILDARLVGGYVALVDYEYSIQGSLALKVYPPEGPILGQPIATLPLGNYSQRFLWLSHGLVVLRSWASGGSSYKAELVPIDLSDPARPRLGEAFAFDVPLTDEYARANDLHTEEDRLEELRHAFTLEGNPVLVDNQVLVLVAAGVAYSVDLRDAMDPRMLSSCDLDFSGMSAIRPVGHMVYVTEPIYIPAKDDESTSTMQYRLWRIDLRNPMEPSSMGWTDIPGTIVGTSNDGRTLYTTTGWLWESGNNSHRSARTLNIVRIYGESATLLSAILCDWDELVIADERAYLSRSWIDWSRPCMGPDAPYDWEYRCFQSTTITVLGLSDPLRPKVESNLTVFGEFHLQAVSNGMLLLSSQYYEVGWGLLSMDLSHGANGPRMALYDAPVSFDVLDTRPYPYLLIERYNWGLQILRL